MTTNVSVFVATSLDGYIAREDGDLDWLDAANRSVPEGEDCGYQAFWDTVDYLILGRHTFEKVLAFEHWPYGDKPVIVMSSGECGIPETIGNTVTTSAESPEKLLERLSRKGARRLYVDGGNTIQRFLAKHLITDMTITLIPVILGGGIPLLGDVVADIPLQHISTTSYDFGFVQLIYRIPPV